MNLVKSLVLLLIHGVELLF